MAQPLAEWVEQDVAPFKDRPISWLTSHHFFRDPARTVTVDNSYFLSPSDGVLLYQRTVDPDQPVLDIKGRDYSVRDALRQPKFDQRCLVVGIFMTYYDVHINRVPYTGYRSFRELPPLHTSNRPMLDAEKSLLEALKLPADLGYLHTNQRMLNTIHSPGLGQSYYVVQVADTEVDQIVSFTHQQNQPALQGERFGQIRYGSQAELVIPVGDLKLRTIHQTGWHVQAGVDTLVAIEE